MVFAVCFPKILALFFLKKKEHPLIIPWMFFFKDDESLHRCRQLADVPILHPLENHWGSKIEA